ncbi:MAG: helix-turn-helix domain-containing protein [Myxococcota bacterium]
MRLRDSLATLPDDAFVPVGWVREQLDAEHSEASGRKVLLTVRQVAERYERSESTVRGWCARGELSGAFKLHGSEWRVPESALVKLEAKRPGSRPALGRRTPVDIGAWRRSCKE